MGVATPLPAVVVVLALVVAEEVVGLVADVVMVAGLVVADVVVVTGVEVVIGSSVTVPITQSSCWCRKSAHTSHAVRRGKLTLIAGVQVGAGDTGVQILEIVDR